MSAEQVPIYPDPIVRLREAGKGEFPCPVCWAEASDTYAYPHCPNGCSAADMREAIAATPPECSAFAGRYGSGGHDPMACPTCLRRRAWAKQMADTAASMAEGIGSDWEAVDLSEVPDMPVPTIGEYAPGRCLFWEGVVHGVHGKPDSGKTWVAYIAAAQELHKGNGVVLIDHEMVPSLVREWLVMLGATPQQMEANLRLIQPDTPLTGPAWGVLDERVRSLQGPLTLVVIDSMVENAAMLGGSTNDDTEVALWFRTVPKRLAARYGTAVIVIDHIAKTVAEARALYPIGSQRKLAAVMVQLYVRNESPFSAKQEGHSVLIAAKCRMGLWTKREKVARLDGGPVGVRLRTYEPDTRVEEEARLLLVLARHPQGKKAGELKDLSGRRREEGGAATRDRLLSDGRIEVIPKNGSHLHVITEAGLEWLADHGHPNPVVVEVVTGEGEGEGEVDE